MGWAACVRPPSEILRRVERRSYRDKRAMALREGILFFWGMYPRMPPLKVTNGLSGNIARRGLFERIWSPDFDVSV